MDRLKNNERAHQVSGIRNSRRNARFTFPIAVLALQWRNMERKKEIARSPRAVVQRKIIAYACIHFNLRLFCLLLGQWYRNMRSRKKCGFRKFGHALWELQIKLVFDCILMLEAS